MKGRSPKIVEFDIETATAIGKFYGHVYETNIIDVLRQSYILCFAYKLWGEKKVYSHALPDFPRYKHDKHDDEQLVKKLAEVLTQADVVAGHNICRFDLPVTNTRLIFHGFDPLPPLRTLDTCKEAKRVFKFSSNKLDDLGEFLGVGRKLAHTGKHLWNACEDDVYHPKEWKMMRDYNKQDVVLFERVYGKMRPYMAHANLNLFTGENACPKCGSLNLHQRGYRRTLGSEYPRLQCQDCGTWSSGRRETLAKKIHIR